MIIDSLENADLYCPINPLFRQAFDFVRALIKSPSGELGKVVLVERELVVMVNDSPLKRPEQARMEIHNAYIDIHIPLSAPERFGLKSRHRLNQPSEAFDEENDAQHFEDAPEYHVLVHPGEFLVVYPDDAHVGCLGNQGRIKKIIVKVKA